MSRINKIDYFCGAFLSYLISNNVEPTLFDAVDKSKIVNFTQKNTDYNAYLKYVSTCAERKVAGKEHTLWSVHFSEAENDYIRSKFKKDDRENIVVLVCAKPNLKETCVAVLSLDDALECLGSDTKNNQRRISVKFKKGSWYLECYGTAIPDTRAKKVKHNFDEYFGF